MATRTLDLGTHKVLAEVREGIAWLTLNQPERRNAISLVMWQALARAAADFDAAEDVRVVVMRGAGGQAFASGADISEFETQRANATQKAQYAATAAGGQRGLAQLTKPLIAMIEGWCIGGGLALALLADLRIATPGSRFGIPAARLGLGYDYPGVATLARLVGPAVARDLLFSARQLDAEEALRVGLVNQLATPELLNDEVSGQAARIAANAPLTVRAAKAALRLFERAAVPDPAEAAAVARLVDACFDSDDYREGRQAFLDKRTPHFKGR